MERWTDNIMSIMPETGAEMNNIEPYYIELLTILIKYKFANNGTAESNADEIASLFMRYSDDIKSCQKQESK